MSRNKNRVTANAPQMAAAAVPPFPPQQQHQGLFNFVVPTEIVDLPSKGEFYPPGHPLHGVDSVEIKHMTAKEEDILTSQSLIRKGIAINRVLESIIVDDSIRVDDLLIGDKNALIIASRIYGYGADYDVSLTCQNCSNQFETTVDLNSFEARQITFDDEVQKTENNTFLITLPKSEFVVEFRLLTSRDEAVIAKEKNNGTTGLLRMIVVSINGQTDSFYIDRALQVLPIRDASVLKKLYASVVPDVDMSYEIDCPACSEVSRLEVPLTAEFFWPNL